jgi:hypothetical protein
MYRYNGTSWTSIGGGGISGTGTATYIPYWNGSSSLATTTLTFTTGGGYPTTTISGTTTTSFDISQGDPATSGQAAGYVVRRQSNNKVLGLLLGKDSSVLSGTPIFHTYCQDDYFFKIFGSTDYYHGFYKNGNVSINTQTDAGYKLDVNGTIRTQGTIYTSVPTTTDIINHTAGTFKITYGSAGVCTWDGYNGSIFQNANVPFLTCSLSSNLRIRTNAIIGADTTNNASCLFELVSTTQGLGIMSMTTVQKNAIGTPKTGLMVYDSTALKMCFYDGTAWRTITSV